MNENRVAEDVSLQSFAPSPSAAARNGRALFIDMPFRVARVGNLGLSTLKAILERAGLATDIRYLSVDLARAIDPDLYAQLARLGTVGFSGEILFTPHFYGLPVEKFIRERLTPYLTAAWRRHPVDQALFAAGESAFLEICGRICQEDVPALIATALEEIDWDRYDVIGFSLVFDQTLPSLTLAREVKKRYPAKTILFGGPACDGEMGLEILRTFPFVDIVAIGEADLAIVPLVCALRDGRSPEEVPGLGYRKDGEVVRTAAPPLLQNLDQLPMPSYEEYFDAIRGSTIQPHVFFELSRGCWWGQKHLCTFCGLNANGLTYRRKSAERALQEITGLVDRYQCRELGATDNILDISFFKTVFPALKAWRDQQPEARKVELFYELKSNAKKAQLTIAREAGLAIAQPGIESFSDHILELMDKGATGIQQVQFVRWATELGLSLQYGILCRNPGETAADYEEMLELVDYVQHLLPPLWVTELRLDRFSPYFNAPERYGIMNVRPHPSYGQIFLQEDLDLQKLAYHFVFDHADHRDAALSDALRRLVAAATQWRFMFRHDTLTYDVTADGVRVLDRRYGQPLLATLKGLQAEIFLYCDEVHTLSAIQDRFAAAGRERVAAFLETLRSRKWLYRDRKGRCLALPVRRESVVGTKARVAPREQARTADLSC